jgi:hypothetical protein
MRTHTLSTASWRAGLLIARSALVASALAGCLRNPSADAATAQALTEIAEQLAALQQDNAALQSQIDSLLTVVARQDTVVRRVANLAGVPLSP